eukprot:scaffold23175_cov115-Isochrysis_galbana.AAC.3
MAARSEGGGAPRPKICCISETRTSNASVSSSSGDSIAEVAAVDSPFTPSSTSSGASASCTCGCGSSSGMTISSLLRVANGSPAYRLRRSRGGNHMARSALAMASTLRASSPALVGSSSRFKSSVACSISQEETGISAHSSAARSAYKASRWAREEFGVAAPNRDAHPVRSAEADAATAGDRTVGSNSGKAKRALSS